MTVLPILILGSLEVHHLADLDSKFPSLLTLKSNLKLKATVVTPLYLVFFKRQCGGCFQTDVERF